MLIAAKLTLKQRTFAELLAQGVDQMTAYAQAGYKVDAMTHDTHKAAAYRTVSNGNVKKYYDALRAAACEKAADRQSYTEEEWLKTQLELLSYAMGRKEVKKIVHEHDEVMINSRTKTVDVANALRIQEQLGKMLSLFVDRQEVTGDMTVTNLISELSTLHAESKNDSPLPKDNT